MSETPSEADLNAHVVQRVALGEWVMLAAFFAVGIFVYQQIYGPLTAQGNASGDPVNNAALFPRLVANLILGLCCLQLIQLLRRKLRLSVEFLHSSTRENIQRCVAAAVILPLYLLGLPAIGFYPATAAFLLAMFVLLKARPLWMAAFWALLITFAVGYVFEDLLRVVLPQGRIPFFP